MRPAYFLSLLGLALSLTAVAFRGTTVATLPDRLTDREFWSVVEASSEPGGYFRSANITNLTSNELYFQFVIPELLRRTQPASAYLGVGPEQNFTYIAAMRPRVAIIFDIRRGNLDLQLMYKAIFELAPDRASFLSLLFSRTRPAGLTARSTAAELFGAFARSPRSDTLARQNRDAILKHLTTAHGFPLATEDREDIVAVHDLFVRSGFALRSFPTYENLMTTTDEDGVARSFLASEDGYRVLRDLETRNLVVPVVGDFGGPKAIRAVARFLKRHELTVSAFYLSNVEQYLRQDGKWDAFCRNVAALPLTAKSTFIRSSGGGGRGGFVSSLGDMAREVGQCR